MAKKDKKRRQARRPTGNGPVTDNGERGPDFWRKLEEYNALDARLRPDALRGLGMEDAGPDVIAILAKSHFVIPGKTRHECVQCGECCRYAKKVANFTYEPCPFLTEAHLCGKHEHRYQVCRWFPFWLYTDAKQGRLLTIKPYCTGYGKGALVEYGHTVQSMVELSRNATMEADGAIVIHELLYLPEKREWVFPSPDNVDALLKFIATRGAETNEDGTKPARHLGELHYAHHYTSGLLGGANEPQLTVDEKGIITDVNESFMELSKRGRNRLVDNEFHMLFVNPEGARKFMTLCYSRGKVTADPQRLALPDGSGVALLLNGMVYRDRTDGLVHASLVCATPVSSTVYNEVTQSQNYARGLLEASLDALAVIDLDGIITDVNEATVRITGRPRELLNGTAFAGYFDDPSAAQKGLDLARSQGNLKNYELNLIDADGGHIPVSFNATVYVDAGGIVRGIFAAARDIREIRSVMRELEKAKNYARGLIETGLDLMVTINRVGEITDVNEAAVRMTGRERHELIGSRFKDYFSDPCRAEEGVELVFMREQLRNYMLMLVSREGNTVPVSFNATVYRDADGECREIFAVARDISERLAMVRGLEEARKYSRGLIESCLDLMVTIDPEGFITDVNEAAVRLTGRARDELIGSLFREYFSDRQEAQKGVEATYRDGHVTNYILELLDRSNRKVRVSFNANVYMDSGGMVQGIFAVAREIV